MCSIMNTLICQRRQKPDMFKVEFSYFPEVCEESLRIVREGTKVIRPRELCKAKGFENSLLIRVRNRNVYIKEYTSHNLSPVNANSALITGCSFHMEHPRARMISIARVYLSRTIALYSGRACRAL